MSLEKLKNWSPGSGKKVLCLEVNPPRGTDIEPIFSRLEGKVSGIDFFNVTDSALANMRMAALPFASQLKARFSIEPLVNMSCRDRNLIAIQSDLLAGWTMDIRSIIALTGDAVSIGDMPEAKGVFEVNSVGLLNVVETLNNGKDLAGNSLKGSTAYMPGVVVNPNAKNHSAEIKRLARKKDAGAKYALSQPVFDESVALEFFRDAASIGIPVLMGLFALKSNHSARALTKVPGIRLSDEFLAKINGPDETDISELSLAHCLNLAKAVRGYVAGFHVISGVTPKLGLTLAEELASHLND